MLCGIPAAMARRKKSAMSGQPEERRRIEGRDENDLPRIVSGSRRVNSALWVIIILALVALAVWWMFD